VALAALAKRIELLPETGAFEPIDIEVTLENHRTVLWCSPVPAGPEATRFLEVRVASPTGQSTSSRWLTTGTTEELAAHARWPETADDVQRTVCELIES
jgi:hypothetical protein